MKGSFESEGQSVWKIIGPEGSLSRVRSGAMTEFAASKALQFAVSGSDSVLNDPKMHPVENDVLL